VGAFICILEIRLHLRGTHDLKGKRKLLNSLKDRIRTRFGAAVAEVDGHGKWQSSTLVCALVGGPEAQDRAAAIERMVLSMVPEGCAFDRKLLSLEDIGD